MNRIKSFFAIAVFMERASSGGYSVELRNMKDF